MFKGRKVGHALGFVFKKQMMGRPRHSYGLSSRLCYAICRQTCRVRRAEHQLLDLDQPFGEQKATLKAHTMMGIASRSNSSKVIRKQAVVAPQVPVSSAVRPPGLGDVAQHGTVSHESTTAPQSNGMNHAMSKYSTKKTHGFLFKMAGH